VGWLCWRGGNKLAVSVNAGARLDRLPTSSFHRRILLLIAIGMFFDGFDVYLSANVLGATLKSGFSTIGQNAQFVPVTFLGMMLGSFFTGFLGDRYGRRFTYQANLGIFGLASIAAAFAPSMRALIALRGIMGLGLGAEIVVGFSTMTEFVPPQTRGKWLGAISISVVTSLPISALLGTLLIPRFGWRLMFLIWGNRRPCSVVLAQGAARIAALARIRRSRCRGGSDFEGN
jgi:MFS transporter, putative metabolite:H+ symporter